MTHALPILLVCGALAAPAMAQEAEARPDFRFFDGVVGIIDDQVITASELRPQVQEQIQKDLDDQRKRQPGLRVDPEVLAALERRWTRHFARKQAIYLYQLSQIRELDVPEDTLEQAIQTYVDRRIEEEIRQAGNNLALIQNLRLQGKTMAEHKRDIRNEYIFGLLRSQQWQRFASAGHLKITPREMLDEYERNRDSYHITAKARVRVFQLAGGAGTDGVDAAARELARALRRGEDAEALAKANKAVLIDQVITPTSGFLGFVKDFVFDPTHRPGLVSDPLAVADKPGSLYVVQLVERQDEGWRPFTDPDLQREIQRKLLERRILRLEERDESRSRTRIRTWPPDLLEDRGPAR